MFCVSSDLNSGKKVRVFSFSGGVFCVSSDLNSGKKVEIFIFGGGGCSVPNPRTGVFWENLVKIFWKPSWLVHHR